MATTEPTNKVPTDTPHAVPVSRDLAYEIAAVSAAILDTEEEKTATAKEYTATLKKLKKRQRELIAEIRTSADTQLVMNFGSTVRTEIKLAESAPTEDDGSITDADRLEERVSDLEAELDSDRDDQEERHWTAGSDDAEENDEATH